MILINAQPQHDWLVRAVNKRLREEFAKLRVEINEDKSRMVDLKKGESFTFLGFEYRRILSRTGKWRPNYASALARIDPTLLAKSDPPHRYVLVLGFGCDNLLQLALVRA